MLPEYDLTDKRVLITGAGRGIGKGIALVLAEAGAHVAVTALTEANAQRVAEEVRRRGRRALGLVADATKQEDMDRLAQRVLAEWGGLDVLINCVGDAIQKPVVALPGRTEAGMTLADWRTIVDINLTEAFLGCRAFGPYFLSQRRGNVINISSFAAYKASPLRSAYDAAKAGLTQFTRSLALEWAPYGIRVNAIAPGLFPDPEQLPPEEYRRRQERAVQQVPLGRLGTLREVGLLAAYLASDASAYVTGQTFVIDGGLSIT
ncbi:MAG: SDR family oxidoreductase [Dehalococcoidia bacterium]|nr:SDR family oxidoreductase [Dehalococcoidia bacterium]MDW8119488.1 SDR family NAD(P)-dependent oxidoreductase [Chloroflexota bacterium]